jgi:hypothetical protein
MAPDSTRPTDEYQTTFAAAAFGAELQQRVAAARAIQRQAVALFHALNEQRAGEWQPAAIDQAIHYATRAVQTADEPVYEQFLSLAEDAVAAAEYQFPDAASSRDPAHQPATATEGT